MAPPCVIPCNTTDAEATAETELREWASGQKVTMKTIDLFAKEGFNSMGALALLDPRRFGPNEDCTRPTKAVAFGDTAVATITQDDGAIQHGR